jgi:hypothetical protein
MIKEILPAQVIVDSMVAEAAELLQNSNALLVTKAKL